MSSTDSAMDCNPEPANEVLEPATSSTSLDNYCSQDQPMPSSSASENTEVVELTAKPVEENKPSESLERHNFQALELDMQLKEMSFKLKTENSLDPQVYALLGQLSVLKADMQQHQDKLDLANRTIGFLEAQIRVQQAQIEELRALSAKHATPATGLLQKLIGKLSGRL